MDAAEIHQKLPEEFFEISTSRAWLRILFPWAALISIVGTCEYFDNASGRILALFLVGWLILFIDETAHRALHKTLFRKRCSNSNFQIFYSLPIFQALVPGEIRNAWPHKYYAYYADPERALYQRIGIPPGRHTSRKALFYWFVAPFLGYSLLLELSRINRRLFYSPGYRLRVIGFWVPVLLTFFLYGLFELLFWYWLLPFFLIAPILRSWLKISRHYKTAGPYYCRDLGRTLSWTLFGGAVPDYTAHMLYPSVPHDKLKQVTDQYLEKEHRVVATNFLQLSHQICFGGYKYTPSKETGKAASP